MTITKRVTFIAKEGYEDKMKELLTAMVEPSEPYCDSKYSDELEVLG